MKFKDIPIGSKFTYLSHTFQKTANVVKEDVMGWGEPDLYTFNCIEVQSGTPHIFSEETEIEIQST